jgi:hypothetical protein
MIPRTYAEWMLLLDRFGEGDDTVIVFMRQGTLDWTNVVAERWTRQVAACLTARLQFLSQQLQRMLDRSRDDHFAISNSLLITRRGLTPLRMFVQLPVLPEEVKQHLVSELDRWALETQKSLERHAAGVRHDQGRLLKTIRDHPLMVAFSEPVEARASEEPTIAADPVSRARRVIL